MMKSNLVQFKAFMLTSTISLCILSISHILVNGQVLIDCLPDNGSNPTEETCSIRGCQWNSEVPEGAPLCTFPEDYGYTLVDDPTPSSLGEVFHLQRKNQPTMFGNDISDIFLSVEYWSETIVRLKFYDPNNARYEVPIPITAPTSQATQTDYITEYTNDPSFGISIIRKSTGEIIFNTGLPGFTFSDQFLQISSTLPSSYLYGFGEHRHKQLLHDLNWRTWTMFAMDNPPEDNYNLYGVQPFYMNLENSASANGVFLLNSNAMEVKLQPAPAWTYRTIGGILDFYIFLGPSPENVVQQFSSLIGYPYLPPYWGLGFQLSRWGVASADDLQATIQRMRNANLPYDVQYSDIDYMDSYLDFTRSPTNYSDLPNVVQDLHDHDQKYIVILDAAIGNQDYYGLQRGLQDDIFIKFPDGRLLEAVVWPGRSYFPDYSSNKTQSYWSEMCRYLYEDLNVQYDGLWIDMNEPSNFITGSTSGCDQNQWNHPPYAPSVLGSFNGGLMIRTICMEAVQEAGRHYDVHSLFGYHMGFQTFNALRDNFPDRRPLVVSRSQFAGSGRYATHWLGDNASTFGNLKNSIIGMLEYNMFGMPYVGADICGFQGDTTEELCIRWSQLGSMYPFSRNHNTRGTKDQDPPSLGQRVVDANMKAFTERYRLLPYLYTLLHAAHVEGGTVVRPLFHVFPRDNNTLNIDRQFMWGSGLLISPVVDEGLKTVDAYFPSARWYDYYTGAELATVGVTYTLSAPLDGYMPLHVHGGVIIPTQEPNTTTTLSRKNPMGLIVPLDKDGRAGGTLFWDDGETFQTDELGIYNEFSLSAFENTLEISVVNAGFGMNDIPNLNSVSIYGLPVEPAFVTVDSEVLDSSRVKYDEINKVLFLSELNLKLLANHTINF